VQKKDCLKIKNCRLCNSNKIRSVLNLGNTPLANSYKKKNISLKLKKYPLGLNLCKECGHLQLTHSIKPQKMFSNYLYKTNTSQKNFMHFKNYANEIKKKYKNKNKILDIASNDGTFLSFFDKKKFFRLGVDPAKNLKKVSKSKGIDQIDIFFTKKNSYKLKKKYGTFDLITANHVCAHVENLKDFFQGVKNLLKPNGIFIFEVSYRGSVLKKNTFDTIYHEHLDYHALMPLAKFLIKNNLYLSDYKITKAQGGSLRIYASKEPKSTNKDKILKQKTKEIKIYKLFNVSTYKKFEKKINICKIKLQKILGEFHKKELSVAGYGAAAKTTTFLYYFNLAHNNQIKYIFDDNYLKQGLNIPGTTKQILNPKSLKSIEFDILIIFAWNYSDVIIEKLKKKKFIRNKNIRFLVPFPNPKII